MLIAKYSRISSKKLGFVAGFSIIKHSKSYSVTIFSPKGIFGSLNFKSEEQAFNFVHFLGVPKDPIKAAAKSPPPANKQISLFN